MESNGNGTTTEAPAVPPTQAGRSFGLTPAQSSALHAGFARSIEACMREEGFEVTIDEQPSGGGRIRFGDRGTPTDEEREAMDACTDAASDAQVVERDRLLREAGNPVTDLALSACPALEEVVRDGVLPPRFVTDGVLGHAGGVPLETCFGTIEAPDGNGSILVREGLADDDAAADEDRGTYRVGPVRDGFLAVYTSDQLPTHVIEATGVTEPEFDALIASLQPG